MRNAITPAPRPPVTASAAARHVSGAADRDGCPDRGRDERRFAVAEDRSGRPIRGVSPVSDFEGFGSFA
ncbi:hypothetical protein ASF49_05070 [Methylobacterium sp. Leaf104]|nr:hypothetical protein ASF49_05070 [Methylobacterium sp. Leaf104]